MTITLTLEQEQFLQAQLAAGGYSSLEEILQVAFELLANHHQQVTDPEWLADVGQKIDEATASITRGEGLPFDGAMKQIFDRFHAAKES
jgi:antitoxin ParD1/3/4